jgi:UDP-N-acetylmuramate--alanine ligase
MQIKELVIRAPRKSIFFVGIGGINMSSLAHISLVRGMKVGGSDRTPSALTRRLEGEGIDIFYDHDAKNIEGYDLLVYTVAISEDNPEYVAAKRYGIPCISRSDYMGYLMTGYSTRIGISGMHGKSTCTSMCAEALIGAQTDPTVLSGAQLRTMGGAYRVGGTRYFLFEACEYMDSFLDFNPTVSVILNIEMDHVDYFESMDHIKSSFLRFARLSGDDGICVANIDSKNVKDALSEYEGITVWFGLSDKADFRAVNIEQMQGCYSFDIVAYGELLCHVDLHVCGYHNIYNALACAAALSVSGVSANDIRSGLEAFCGAERRMEYKGRVNGARVYDDYGHHPTEVRATLAGARDMTDGEGRLFCVFQSHTYSRTAALLGDFASALDIADRVAITDIYAARETDTMGITPELFAECIGEKASACHGFHKAAELLRRELREGDVAIVMGAGDVWHTFEYLDLEK